ncbi:MAG TPA: SDR family NAD(P)-dependent oxidoreductase, partial [Xenococcaceae cyanobacterium]
GSFVEIGKIGIWSKQKIKETRKDINYYPFDLLEVSQDNPGLIKQMFKELTQQFNPTQKTPLQPLPYQEFPFTAAEAAFRYMASAKHIGKVVLSQNISRNIHQVINSESSYLITGGLGALGLQVAQWLVNKGAKQLVLVGRNQPTATAIQTIKQLEATGANIKVIQGDISNFATVQNIISASHLPVSPSTYPLKGIIHAAGVLDDCLLQQLSPTSLEKVMLPKVKGAWNLHLATQNIPLDFFICFSSITSLLGTIGQGNYAAANSFMDSLMQQRQASGLPGISINWGLWESGMSNSLAATAKTQITQQGIEILTSDRALQILETILTQPINQVAVFPVNWEKFLQDKPNYNLYQRLKPKSKPVTTSRSKFLQHLETIPESDRFKTFLEYIRIQVTKVLGFNEPESIDIIENFGDLGMDSLMAVELKNQLQTSLDTTVPLSLIFDYPTVESLSNYLFSVNTNQQTTISNQQLANNHQQSIINEQPSTNDNQQSNISNQPSTINQN